MPIQEHSRLSVVSAGVERGEPVTRIIGHLDGSFILLDENAAAREPDEAELVACCIDCLLDQHPEVASGLSLAAVHRAAHLVDGGWVGGE